MSKSTIWIVLVYKSQIKLMISLYLDEVDTLDDVDIDDDVETELDVDTLEILAEGNDNKNFSYKLAKK